MDAKTNLATLPADVQAYIKGLEAKAAGAGRAITFKVTAPKPDKDTGEMKGTSGAISAYGLGKFPITLYAGQWERLMAAGPALAEFIKTNEKLVSRKA